MTENKVSPLRELSNPWHLDVIKIGERLSQNMEEKFMTLLKQAEEFRPKGASKAEGEANVIQIIEILFDYLFGTAVAIAAHYATTDEQFEKNVIAMVQHKFKVLREMQEAGSKI